MSFDRDIVAAKKAMRLEARTVRQAANDRHGGEDAGKALARNGLALDAISPGAVVSGFQAIDGEIDVAPLLQALHDRGHAICLPVMIGKGQPLIFRLWRPGDQLAEVKWGIREPLPEAPAAVPDVVLAALLAFDSAGHRLGYGGGFYDRTLKGLKARKPVTVIGIAFDEQEVEAVPTQPYDEPIDWVLTPSGARRLGE